ncbi:hypothetical protein [Streptomyces albus]|nr:hypothetical protein [Streptomyces albus]
MRTSRPGEEAACRKLTREFHRLLTSTWLFWSRPAAAALLVRVRLAIM